MSLEGEKFFEELKKLKVDYLQLFNTDQGRRVLEDIKRSCCVYTSTYVKGDRESTFINEGARRVVLAIENMMNMPVEQLAKDYKQRSKHYVGG